MEESEREREGKSDAREKSTTLRGRGGARNPPRSAEAENGRRILGPFHFIEANNAIYQCTNWSGILSSPPPPAIAPRFVAVVDIHRCPRILCAGGITGGHAVSEDAQKWTVIL